MNIALDCKQYSLSYSMRLGKIVDKEQGNNPGTVTSIYGATGMYRP